MISLAQVTALVEAHVNRDHERFRAITLQIAADISSRSERGAGQLRKLIEKQPPKAHIVEGIGRRAQGAQMVGLS